jgi:hypothetical protein
LVLTREELEKNHNLCCLGAWLTAALLFLFAFIGRSVALRESKRAEPMARQD